MFNLIFKRIDGYSEGYSRIRLVEIEAVVQYGERPVQIAFFNKASYDDLVVLVDDSERRQKIVAFDEASAVNDVKNRRADLGEAYDKIFLLSSFADDDQKRNITV
jgi:hypothetical protein